MLSSTKLGFKLLPLNVVIFLLLMNLLHGISGSEYSDTTQDRIKCPLRCKCDRNPDNSTEWEVLCDAKTSWTRIPLLPMNTIYLCINKSSIPVLRNGVHRNVGSKALKTLILSEDNISTIDVEYFKGMDQLKELVLYANNLRYLLNETFAGIPNLLHLSLDGNKFDTMPSDNICLLTELQMLNMISNNLKSARFDNCFSNITGLCRIYISKNPIRKIELDDFYSLRNSPVSALYLKTIGLTALQGMVFKWLPNLKVLDLQENKLTHLQSDSFRYITGLTFLMLRGNSLNGIPSDAIARLTNLKYLDLSKNNIRNSTLGPEFQNMRHLTQLLLSSNPFNRLFNRSFENLNSSTGLVELHLSASKLQKIEADAFLPLRYLVILRMESTHYSHYIRAKMFEQAFYGLRVAKNFTEIHLDNTHLTDLNNETFQYLVNTSVKYFRARGSRIRVIPSGTFKHLPNLQHLDLYGNWIREIEPNAFNSVNQLTYIDLSKSSLQLIPNANSANLVNLKHLMLGKNHIVLLKPETFTGYTLLEELNLRSNGLTTLTPNIFICASNLKVLVLSDNLIHGIARDAFAGLEKLERLVLAWNRVVEISVDTFIHTPNLRHLELSGNSAFAPVVKGGIVDLLKPLKNLTVLKMVLAGLENLPENVFHNLTELSILSLSNNPLSNLDSSLFRDQSKLTILSLKKNKFMSLKSNVPDPLTSLERLDLSENMFHCDCNLMWFLNWIRSGLVYMANLDSTTCKFPAQKRVVLLQNLHMERECMNYTFYYICWSVISCYVFIVTLMTMIYRLRWYIKYWLHLVRARKAMEREMAEERYVFDAFVSYAHQDMKWVVRELLPNLEYEAKIRLCLHQRNWLAGRSIARNIIDSIEKSRKTVLVLSNSFARSKWGELEMSLAQHKLLTTRREIVVPILLEDINKRYVTEQMVCLFATQTYVKWPRRNEKEQRKFWRKLIKTLRPPTDQPLYDEDNKDFLTTEVYTIRPAL